MSCSNAETSGGTKFMSFISESEVEEKKKKRQEEWEKVRSADQPLEAPEEEYDPRSLYEKLKSQKDQKDLEYEEAHKLKNMIKGLDDDEVSFLDLVDHSKEVAENRRWIEEMKEIEDYRKAVSELCDENADGKVSSLKKSISNAIQAKKKSQSSLLAGIVKVKRKSSESESNEPEENKKKVGSSSCTKRSSHIEDIKPRCIGILPGVGEYNSDSSDSERSSSSDFNDYDLDLVKPKKQKTI